MNLKDAISEKLKLIDDVPLAFIEAVAKVSSAWASLLELLIEKLDTIDGNVVPSQDNLLKINYIKDKLLEAVFNDDDLYFKALKEYAESLLTQKKLNDTIFALTFGERDIETDFVISAYKTSRRSVIKLFAKDKVTNLLIDPIGDILIQSVTVGADYKTLAKALTDIIKGNSETLGNYQRYVNTYAKTAFSNFDRSYSQTVAKAYGNPVWWRYMGGLVRDSRQFCKDREAEFYHIKEIEDWGKGIDVGDAGYPWAGMNKETNQDTIKILLGGWNCNHALVPQDEFFVPDDVKQRVKKKGYL